jgi:uncharacterized membrane protein
MNARSRDAWDALRASYWFVPILLAVAAGVLSMVTLAIDEAVARQALGGTAPAGGADGARTLLSTVAASMITVAGVVFSIMIVAMTLASVQFGPRLLRNFMRDLGNQVALGVFVADFLYCILVLRTVRDAGDPAGVFVPNLSITVAVAMTVASLGVFIFFIHHAAASIQVGQIISVASRDLDRAIDDLYPERLGHDPPDGVDARLLVPPELEREGRPVPATGTGYVEVIDVNGVMSLAVGRDLVVSLEVRPGMFVEPDNVLARVWPPDRADGRVIRELDRTVLLAPQRTEVQDVEFAIQQLVQVAVRALSPAINDPWTAFMALDRLGAALSRLCARHRPSPFRFDGRDRLRVIADAATFDALVSQAFTEIRHAGRSNLLVTVRLLETIAVVAEHAHRHDELAALRRHADRVEHGSTHTLPEEWERRIIEERYRQALEILGARDATAALDAAAAPDPASPDAASVAISAR